MIVLFEGGGVPKVSGLEFSATNASERKNRAEIFVFKNGLISKRD